MSETIIDESAGFNGSFEVVQEGLPVNWMVYTPSTIPSGEYNLIVDTTDYYDGRQSLKFLVRECSSTGGWHSPGLSREIPVASGETYGISLWIRNEGAEFSVKVGAVSATDGEEENIIRSSESARQWRRIDHVYTIPPQMNRLRFEMNVLKPGVFWIDEVKIEKIANKN